MLEDAPLRVDDMDERTEALEVVEARRREVTFELAWAPSVPVLRCTKLVGPEIVRPDGGSSDLLRRSDSLRCDEMLVLRLSVG